MRNVEIKAKIEDIDQAESKAASISDSGKIAIEQKDTFFNVQSDKSSGRLKLREFQDNTGELIFYDRPDTEGPKISKYEKINLDSENFSKMKNLLSLSNGVLGTVEKTRHLYLIGQTRIHIDKVTGLGHFLELEVVLNDNEDLAMGQKISENLMEKLGIHQDSLISGAYLDLLLNKH